MAPTEEALCPATTLVESIADFQDFSDFRAVGWINGKVDQTGSELGPFLGPYQQGDSKPYKIYKVPDFSTERVVFKFDFYEIDSWDGDNKQHGTDTLGLLVDGDVSDVIGFGWFNFMFEENMAGGISPLGVKWTMTSQTIANSPQGGLASYPDQTHTFVADIPKVFFSGQRTIKLTITWNLVGALDERVGIDNIRSVACIDTVPSVSPSDVPSTSPTKAPTPSPTRPPVPTTAECADEGENCEILACCDGDCCDGFCVY
jgi:hypothetical protein